MKHYRKWLINLAIAILCTSCNIGINNNGAKKESPGEATGFLTESERDFLKRNVSRSTNTTQYDNIIKVYDDKLNGLVEGSEEHIELTRIRDSIKDGKSFWNLPLSTKFSRKVYLDNNQFDTVDYAYGAYEMTSGVNAGTKVFTFFFEGTSANFLDWETNFNVKPIEYYPISGKVLVHRGYLAYFNAAISSIESILSIASNSNETVVVLSAGYSQGGAIAKLVHEHLKGISGKNGMPTIKIKTVTFGSPGVIYNISELPQPGLTNFIKNTRDIVQLNYGYDFVPYFYHKIMPPIGAMRYIGPYEKKDRASVGAHTITDSTPLIQDRIFIAPELYNEVSEKNNHDLAVKAKSQFSQQLEGVINMNGFDLDTFIFDSINGGYNGPTPTFHPENIDHTAYMGIYGGNPLERAVNFTQEFNIKYINDVTSYKTIHVGGGTAISSIGNVIFDPVLTNQYGEYYNWKATRTITFEPGVRFKKGVKFTGDVDTKENGDNSDFLTYYNDPSNWSSKSVGNGTFIINKEIVINEEISLPNTFDILIDYYGSLILRNKFSIIDVANNDPNVDEEFVYDNLYNTYSDVNGDGVKDLIQIGEKGTWIGVLDKNKNFKYWTGIVKTGRYKGHYGHFFEDVNGDKRVDLIQRGNEKMWIGIADSRGKFNIWTHSVATGRFDGRFDHFFEDVNGDNRKDLIQIGDTSMWIGIADTSGKFNIWTHTVATGRYGGRYGHFFADINGDKRVDLIQRGDRHMWVGVAQPNGKFHIWSHTLATGRYGGSYDHEFYDYNKDGYIDLIQTRPSSGEKWVGYGFYNGWIQIWSKYIP